MIDSNDVQQIAGMFDVRAANYDKNKWHTTNACRLAELAPLKLGDFVLDAATGTGMAAIAAAKRVGTTGRVLGVDLSGEMLKVARQNLNDSQTSNVVFLQADATSLPSIESGSIDNILCAAGLLYMPLARALNEWKRLLRVGGGLSFSTMASGSPPAGKLFRECALRFGLSLRDPSAPLGTVENCIRVLEDAGLVALTINYEQIDFGSSDFEVAWESNVRSAGHENVQLLSHDQMTELRNAYIDALEATRRNSPRSLDQADIIYVVARKQEIG